MKSKAFYNMLFSPNIIAKIPVTSTVCLLSLVTTKEIIVKVNAAYIQGKERIWAVHGMLCSCIFVA